MVRFPGGLTRSTRIAAARPVRSSCLALLLAAALTAGCAGSSSSSSPSELPRDRRFDGLTVGALDGAPAAGMSVRVGDRKPVTTDVGGYFTAEIDGPGEHAMVINGPGVVQRLTKITGPTSERAKLSLIPASFDLTAFDEMFRSSNARLQRWRRQPSLVVVASAMTYRGPAEYYAATPTQMSEAEVSSLIEHLTEGLALLTGGTFTAFANVQVERPGPGERVLVTRAGQIVVGRFDGIGAYDTTIGYGRWAEEPDGTISAGVIFLDRVFDRDDPRRRLLRIHELGHALGYQHVTSRSSIMNPSVGAEPREFDRQAAIVAFQRSPGNVAPDTDPGVVARIETGWLLRWSTPVGCSRGL
jgi:hypothetical protein